MIDRVLLDTTTLCSAIRRPSGVNMKLLHLGRLGLFEPVITESVVGEWLRLCRAGLGHGRSMAVYGEAELDAFCEALEPLLEPGLLARVRDRAR